MKRIIWIVLDSVGCGSLPDAALYGDDGSNTLRHIIDQAAPMLPNLEKMGLRLLLGLEAPVPDDGCGVFGRAMEVSAGKDTTTGHWEMAGLKLDQPFPTYPEGFPDDVITAFEKMIGTKVIGNKPASGTAILEELGDEHLSTGYPIVYTSGDSVFQIACHESLYPVEKLYEICRKARDLLQGKHGVGRVIARPFKGRENGTFIRTPHRRDFSMEPVGETVLNVLQKNGIPTMGIGKIEDIFCMQGLDESDHAVGNPACMDALMNALAHKESGLIYVNLVDFDSAWGHRRDVQGYAAGLEAFDAALPALQKAMTADDLLMICADHGCDPTWTGTDHTREYVPVLCWHKGLHGLNTIGTRKTYADMAATISEIFGCSERFGAESFAGSLQLK